MTLSSYLLIPSDFRCSLHSSVSVFAPKSRLATDAWKKPGRLKVESLALDCNSPNLLNINKLLKNAKVKILLT